MFPNHVYPNHVYPNMNMDHSGPTFSKSLFPSSFFKTSFQWENMQQSVSKVAIVEAAWQSSPNRKSRKFMKFLLEYRMVQEAMLGVERHLDFFPLFWVARFGWNCFIISAGWWKKSIPGFACWNCWKPVSWRSCSTNRSLFDKDWFYLVAKFKWSMLARTPSRGDGARNGMLNDAAMFLYVAPFLAFVCGTVSRFVDIITSVCYLRLMLAALLC